MRGYTASAILLLLWSVCAVSSGGSDGGGIRVLQAGAGKYGVMASEPLIEVHTFVPASLYFHAEEVIQRAVRIYMPRTYETLIDGYDVISLVYAEHYSFGPKYRQWFADAVIEAGMGLFLENHDFSGRTNLQEWTQSEVAKTVPVENTHKAVKKPCRIRILRPNNPIIASLPWSTIGIYGNFAGYTRAEVKEGSEILMELVPASGRSAPLMVWWDVGEGRSLTYLTVYASTRKTPADPFRYWEYKGDLKINCHLFVAKNEIPPDAGIVHQIRLTIEDCHFAQSDLISMIEFISKIGGNPSTLDQMLIESDDQLREIERAYISYDFDQSLALAHELVEYLGGVYMYGLEVKDKAFFWIYLAEWLTLTATSIVAGSMVWSLMVRRRLYRDTQTIRLRKSQHGEGFY